MYNIKIIFILLLHLSLSHTTLSVFAQDSLFSHQSARFEIGPGIGIAGKGSGVSGRFALSYLHSNWGGVLRFSAHDGGEGSKRGWFGTPKEKFYDYGILCSYVIDNMESWQLIAGAGVGSLYGERLTDTNDSLEDFGRVTGFAYELGIASAGSTVGWSLNVLGNINSISNLVAFFLSLTIGYQK
jgi:hypothetical protein